MKKKKNTYKKPSFFISGLVHVLSKLVCKLYFNLEVTENELKNKKGGYVIIANHESIIDFMTLFGTQRRRMHCVISNSFYESLKIQPLIKMFGAIPKQQFQTTITDLKNMKRVLDNNRPLVLYPSGMMSENGLATPIPKGTGKAIKWFNKDVYFAKNAGTYLTYPKWSKKNRKGKATLSITKLFDKDQLANMDEQEIQRIIVEKLDFDAYKDQEINKIEFKNADNISGLENVLYKCPNCNNEFGIYHQDKKLICKHCNNQVKADKYGFLQKVNDNDICIKHPSDWSKKIELELLEEIKQSEDYVLTSNCRVSMINYKKHKFEEVGEAFLTLNKDAFIIDGIINNEKVNITVSNHETFILPFSPGKHFEIQHGKDIYRIHLDNPQHVMKWILCLKCFYNIRHNENA